MLRSLFFILPAMITGLASNASAQIPDALRAAMAKRDTAVAKADVATWDRLTADDFTVVQESGALMTKAQRIAEMKGQAASPFTPPTQVSYTQRGDVVVRRFRSGDAWVLDVWSKSGSDWRVFAVQVTAAKH